MKIPGNFDRWMFNYKEGNLSQEEINYFESNMLNNPMHSEDVEAWNSAYIRNSQFQYGNSGALIQKSFFEKYGKIAALLLLLISSVGISSFLFIKNDNYSKLYAPRIGNGFELNKTTGNLNNEVFEFDQTLSHTNKRNSDFIISNNQRTSNLLFADNNENLIVEEDVIISDDYSNSIYINYNSSNPEANYSAKKIALNKVSGLSDIHSGSYNANPNYKSSKKSTIKKEKNTVTKSSLIAYKLKKIYHKIENLTGYKVALVNLRDPDLLIPNNNLLNFNPGFTGGNGGFRIGADYRSQWIGQKTKGQTANFYFDTYSKSLRGGVGMGVKYSDYNWGRFQNIVASLFYSPKFVLNKHMVFEPGIKLSMGRMSVNNNISSADKFIEVDRGRVLPIDNSTFTSKTSMWYKDFGLGFVLNTDWLYLGASIDNISMHNEAIYNVKTDETVTSLRKITGIVGFDFQSKDRKTLLSPALIYYQMGTKKEAWASLTTQFNWLTVGASYSSNNEYAASVGMKFKSFRLNYQIDKVESEFLSKSFVSHNIGIKFNTKNKAIR